MVFEKPKKKYSFTTDRFSEYSGDWFISSPGMIRVYEKMVDNPQLALLYFRDKTGHEKFFLQYIMDGNISLNSVKVEHEKSL